jgi:CRP-like cAMP-binding protein
MIFMAAGGPAACRFLSKAPGGQPAMQIFMLALLWGCVSAVSLPLGAMIGLWSRPSQKVTSALMAFGGGALLFALTIELFAHALHRSHQGNDKGIIFATMIGAAAGGLIFELLNRILNDQGGFLRKGALIRKHIGQLKRRRARKMLQAFSRMQIFNTLPADEIVHLVSFLKTERAAAGGTVFRQGDPAQKLYFIVSGRAQVFRETGDGEILIAELGENDVFGEIALITDQPRTGTVRALDELVLYTLDRGVYETLLQDSPVLLEASRKMVRDRLHEMQRKDKGSVEDTGRWEDLALKNLDRIQLPVTKADLQQEVKEHGKGAAALAIWLGIALDGIPESLVIGMLVIAAASEGKAMSLAFIAGVFLANLPEAMSSAVTMRRQGMRGTRIFWMWMSLCIMTGVGAFLGAAIFPANPAGILQYVISGIEGLAAGAMLTMIAETMLPEAFEQGGGSVTGLSTLAGFLAALSIKAASLHP